MLRGVCGKRTFLDLLENFIIYDHLEGRTKKILSRNHQYLGVNRAIEAYRDRKFKDGKLGVFWHTQGGGKSYSMVFSPARSTANSRGVLHSWCLLTAKN